MTLINTTQSSLEAVITSGLATLGDSGKIPASHIPDLVEFILNYYTPDISAFLSTQFIGEPDVR